MRFTAKQLVAATLALIVIATLTTYAQSRAGQRELKRLGIVHPSPAFTELAFDDPLGLPKTVDRTPQGVVIRFTIANRGNRAATYGWKIAVAEAGAAPRVLRSGAVFLAAGRAVTLSPRVELACTTRIRVNVLLSSGDSIGFWAACAGRGSIAIAPQSPGSQPTAAAQTPSAAQTAPVDRAAP